MGDTRVQRRKLGAWLAATSALGVLGCEPERPALRIGSNGWPGYEPLYVARDRAELPEPLRLVELVSASQVLRGLRNRTIEAAGITLDEALRVAAQTGDVELLAVMDVSMGADAVLGRGEVGSLDALRGRRVGVEKSAVGAYLLARALEHARLAPDAVTAVYLPVHEHRAAFERGDVDAIVTFEPTLGELRASGAHTLLTSRDVPGEIVDVLVARRSVVDERPAEIRLLVDCWFRARGLVVDSLSSGRPLATPRLGTDPAKIRQAYEGIELPTRERSDAMLAEGPGSLRPTTQKLLETMRRTGLVRRPLEPESIFPRARG